MLQKIRAHHTVSSYFKQFAESAELVYFGDIKKDDDAHIYKGVTFSPNAKDSHYTHGTVNEYDMTVFSRSTTHSLASGKRVETEWTVMAVHLKMGGFPHIIFDNMKHDREFYTTVFTRFPRLRRAGSVLRAINVSAARTFDMYVRPDASSIATHLFDESVMQRVFSSFSRFDIEIDNDTLYVFKRGLPVSDKELKDMLAETMWIAETIENRAHYASPAVATV